MNSMAAAVTGVTTLAVFISAYAVVNAATRMGKRKQIERVYKIRPNDSGKFILAQFKRAIDLLQEAKSQVAAPLREEISNFIERGE